MIRVFLLLCGYLRYTSSVFPADKEDQKAIKRLKNIPNVPFI